MDANKKKMARNAAKVEFLANAAEVMLMLDKGFNNFNVYSELTAKGRLKMSYRSFCWNLQLFRDPEKKKREKKEIGKPIISTPLRIPAKKEGFGQLEDVDASKLV